ncbi:MAG: hypothetical protein V1813_00190 [Candidatus Aenigmatarchaeota archaeon]
MDVGLIFGMVIAIMVITLVFVFGYQQLTSLQDIQNSAEMIKARQNLEVAVDRVYSEGGESSASLKLGFPPSVARVCFIPLFDYNYNPKEPYTASDLELQLEDQGLAEGSNAEVIAERRDVAKRADGTDYNVLVFFMGFDDPAWYAIEHLEPSIKEDDGDELIFCAAPKETVWLQRKYDSMGAWVDVEED